MSFTHTWNESTPLGTDYISGGAAIIRNNLSAVRERLAVDHEFLSTDVASTGAHNQATLLVQATDPVTNTGAGFIYTKTVTGIELFYKDAAGNIIQLTNAGAVNLIGSGLGTAGQRIRVNAGATALEYYTQYRTVMWYLDGSIITGDTQSATIRVPFGGTIVSAYAYVATAPTGAKMIIQIRKNGTDIWNESPDHRLSILAGAYSGTTSTIDVGATVTAGDYFNLDIDQVGSSVVGSNLTVELNIAEI